MRTFLSGALAALLLVTGAASQAAERKPQANYVLRCAGCHDMDGSGLPKAGIPPFPGLVDAFYNDPRGRLYLMHVPGVASSSLSDREIAGVMNYVAERWSKPENHVPRFTAEEVGRLRAQPVADVVAMRRELVRDYQARGLPVAEYPWP